MIPGVIQPNSDGGVRTEVIRAQPQKESGHLSKKMEGWGGGGVVVPFKPFKGTIYINYYFTGILQRCTVSLVCVL